MLYIYMFYFRFFLFFFFLNLHPFVILRSFFINFLSFLPFKKEDIAAFIMLHRVCFNNYIPDKSPIIKW